MLRHDEIVEVKTQNIAPGKVVSIRPGSRIRVDGQVASGHSFVEQTAITGEPMPSERSAGSVVYAGTMNQAGHFRFEQHV
jgi:P-type E1-E2 ATPase